jgi:PD-(D/E)XK nuclease superfamily protein
MPAPAVGAGMKAKRAPPSSPRLTAVGKAGKADAKRSRMKQMMLPSVAAMSEELAASLSVIGVGSPAELPPEIAVSASKTDLFLTCSWPWGRRARKEPAGPGAMFGSAFHEVIAAWLNPNAVSLSSRVAAEKWGVDREELQERIDDGYPIVSRWLSGDNMWRLDFAVAGLQIEQSVAYNPATDEARFCEGPDEETHTYADRRPGEITGTLDVSSVMLSRGSQTPNGPGGHKTILVLDHKSGWSVAADWQPHTPAESGQLRTLALALAKIHKADRVIVAFFHASRGGLPQIYEDVLTPADLEKHRKDLLQAQRRVGNGWLHPGAWCSTCPGWSICPTQTTTLVELKRGGGALTAEKVGAIHQAAAEYDRARDRLREEMRGWVTQHGPGLRPDGKAVDLVGVEKTNLSQASIIRAMGPLKGGKEIERLRKLGAIETRTNLELRAVRP